MWECLDFALIKIDLANLRRHQVTWTAKKNVYQWQWSFSNFMEGLVIQNQKLACQWYFAVKTQITPKIRSVSKLMPWTAAVITLIDSKGNARLGSENTCWIKLFLVDNFSCVYEFYHALHVDSWNNVGNWKGSNYGPISSDIKTKFLLAFFDN